MDDKIHAHLSEIDRLVAEENSIYLDEDLEETGERAQITSELVAGVVKSIDKQLESNLRTRNSRRSRRNSKGTFC